MDISIHTVISLQPPGEDNEFVKVGFLPQGSLLILWVRTWKLTAWADSTFPSYLQGSSLEQLY